MPDAPTPPAGETPPPPSPTPNPPAPPSPNPPTPPTPPTPPAPPSPPSSQAIADAVAKELGVPLAEAKKLLKAQQDAQRAQMTEAEKAAAEAREAQEKAQKAQAEAAAATQTARVTVALVTAGVHPEKLEWARRLVGPTEGLDDKGLEAAITAAKTAVPEVFSGAAGQNPPPPGSFGAPGSNPPGSPPAPKPNPNVKERAAALVAQRFPQAQTKP